MVVHYTFTMGITIYTQNLALISLYSYTSSTNITIQFRYSNLLFSYTNIHWLYHSIDNLCNYLTKTIVVLLHAGIYQSATLKAETLITNH